jgi:hypothetical protein
MNRLALIVLIFGWAVAAAATTPTPRGARAVIPPWTPVTFRSHTLQVWNRQYILGNSIFPQNISSDRITLLARPITLTCRKGKTLYVARAKGVTTRIVSPGEIDLTGNVSFGGAIQAAVSVRAQYDGLLVYRVALKARPSVTISALSLVIPLKAKIAMYLQKYILMNQDWGRRATRPLPTTQGVIWKSPFNPYLWIGNPEEGLLWFSQSHLGWHTRPSPLRIIRRNNETDFVVSFVNVPTKLSHDFDFEFGLQATPTRPLPRHWRSIGLIKTWPPRKGLSPVAASKPDTVILWPNEKDWRWFGFPQPRHPEQMHALIRSLHSQGVRVLAYVQPEALASNMPAYAANISAWQYVPSVVDNFSRDVLAMHGPIHAVSPASGWANFFLKHLQNFLNTYDVDGVYLDNVYLYPDRNRSRYPSGTVFPVLALRTLLRSIYTMVKKKNPHDLVIVHSSGHDLTPVISYSDVVLDGEQVASRRWTCGTYWKMLSLAEFQGEFAGWQWGPAPMFLSTLGYKRGCLDSYAPSEYALAYALVHGDLLWGQFEDNVLERVYSVYKQFGIATARFVPYWDSARYASVIPDDPEVETAVKVSLYLCRNSGASRALLVISNLGPNNKHVDVKLNPTLLSSTAVHRARIWWFNVRTRKSDQDLKRDALQLSVPRYSFKLAEIN